MAFSENSHMHLLTSSVDWRMTWNEARLYIIMLNTVHISKNYKQYLEYESKPSESCFITTCLDTALICALMFQLNSLLVLFPQVEKIVWPVKLKRFSLEEVISRARRRLDETRYDVLKNNCEHFVTWSMCGLKVSLQVKSWYLWAREVTYSTVAGTYNCIGK